MMRKTVIALAAVAAVTAGSTFGAAAMHPGGMSGGWGGRSFGHAAFSHPGGFAERHAFAFHDHRFAFGDRDRFHFRHRFFRDRFAFIGAPYLYGYGDDDCYSPVRTPWGWRWRSVCY